MQWNLNSPDGVEDRTVNVRFQISDKLRIALQSRDYGLGASTAWPIKSCRCGAKKSMSIVSSVQTNS
jgi:hypothetical protein